MRNSSKHQDELGNIHSHGLSLKDRTIYVHSEFEPEEAGVDFRMASRFIKNLDYLNSLSSDDITVKILSYGGCWNSGCSMYDTIKVSPARVTTISYAHARSMSSIIPQAATKRLISANCDFMVHFGTLYEDGDYRQVVNSIEFTKRSTEVMLDMYAQRCVKGKYFSSKKYSIQDTKKFIRDKILRFTDWWLSANEAVHYGFMDEVI